MPSSHEFIIDVNQLLAKLDDSGDLATGIETANAITKLLGTHETKAADIVVDEQVLQLPNAERYDRWFQSHPWMGGERAAFKLTDAKDVPIQAKFYWLQKRSRQFIAGSVHFTENWEDADYTHNDNFKVGIDFFLSPNGRSLLVALSNRGNIRVVELQHKLNNTQIDIFTKWGDVAQISSIGALHSTLWDSFKLQSVNKDFYKGVSNSFTELLQHLKSVGRNEEDAKLFASRLLGRLLFVWFLRKKNIIDESMGYFDTSSADATSYYRRSLERLFFNTLNTPIDDRDEFKKEIQKQLFPEMDSEPQAKLFQIDHKTPYLNGGLFEPHDNDWYKDSSLTFPEGFFTSLYDHFSQFNFTTDESSPEYEQVAIDPEMLGRVFESLLATQIDDTGQQARKAKGAFYTPREIVSYMCRESLRSYLYGKHDDDERYKKSVDELLDRSDHEWAGAGTNSRRDAVPKEYRTDIVEALDSVTILDPACGSGAFPMGMLQLLIKTYERLEGRFDPYKTKLQIVQNNIFGVDIEPMAVEISRLRAWLSLIVEKEESQDVAPLPNLDFKFVCANTIIPLDEPRQTSVLDPNSIDLHYQLTEIRRQFFNARLPHTKQAAKKSYYKLTQNPTSFFDELRTKQLKSFDPFTNAHPADFFDMDQMFGIEKGFDIVIGNPPWGAKIPKNEVKAIEPYYYSMQTVPKVRKGSKDSYSIFTELGYKLIKEHGVLSYILPMAFSSNESLESLHNVLFENTSLIRISNYFDRPKKIFETAEQATAIILLVKSQQTTPQLMTTNVNKRYSSESISEIIDQLSFVNPIDFMTKGRIPKVGSEIELSILRKMNLSKNRIKDMLSGTSSDKVYYRKSGGRYYKIISSEPTGSREEAALQVKDGYQNALACILSSSLYFWYYQLYSDALHIKDHEIKEFPFDLDFVNDNFDELNKLQIRYWNDMMKNSKTQNTKYKHAKEVRVFHARDSKAIIDDIDRTISGMYDLTESELMFILNFDLKFRTDGTATAID